MNAMPFCPSAARLECDHVIPQDQGGALEKLTADAQRVEVELRAALVIEEADPLPAETVKTPEGRELSELRSRVEFGQYVQAALAGGGNVPRRNDAERQSGR